MLSVRVIPCLLLKNTGLVKTVKFRNPTYIGDPINAVHIFNDLQVDEIIFLDITKTLENQFPNFDLLQDIANECFIPFCYGGGIGDIATMKRIFKLGAEKIAINTAAFNNRNLVRDAAEIFGNQSVVISIDVKISWRAKAEVMINCGKKSTGIDPVMYAIEMQKLGAGELLINSVDRDGTRQGYDVNLLKKITENVDVPVVALGGAGSLEHIKEVVVNSKVSAGAAGSLFVFYGNQNGVLINYPERKTIENLFL
jgi:imidazole glycerol-phosphate synthase subunit HisF